KETLINKAREEERKYNWIEAADLYEKAVKFYLDENLIEKAANHYKNLGYAHFRGADIVETPEDYLKQLKCAIEAYKESSKFFGQLGKRSTELECEAEIYYINGFLATSDMESQKAFLQAIKLFRESSEIYSKESDNESFARLMFRIASTSYFFLNNNISQEEYDQMVQQGSESADKAWEISKKSENIQNLSESLHMRLLITFMGLTVKNFKRNENLSEISQKALIEFNKNITIIDKVDDAYAHSLVYAATGICYCYTGYQFIEDEREQEEYLDKGIELLEKALSFARKTKIKFNIISVLFFIDYFALFSGRINYLQKRILNDIKDCSELGKIYANSYSLYRSLGYILPALYYTNSSQRSFFTMAQRKTYAEKGLQYVKEAMSTPSFPSIKAWLYQGLILAYSQLTILAESKTKQEEYAHLMLQYAKEAEQFGLKYEGGFPQAGGYTSLYKAYKTLADIAKKKEARIANLKNAIGAQKKSINYAILSRSGAITEQMRLGLLYEELGIITGEETTLNQARDIFLHTIKESFDRRYFSYEAASYQYIARIEDRLGNYMLSAENYLKAQEAYNESLKTIKYKLLKNRVNEKFNYVRAWNLIEQAKSFHVRENHIKAKEFYKKAYDILIELPSYDYEASYYFGWISLEEAEQLSKQEEHERAIESFKKTGKTFEEAIGILIKSYQKSREKFERERINQFQKITQVRVNHCNARINLEEARILGKEGENIAAAEKFALASSQFRDICILFKIKREREELEAVYYLCRAWENMELAEKYKDPYRFSEAAGLFAKASDLFTDAKLKFLASGNSTFCQALEYGSKFDESIEMNIKKELYPKVKITLSKAATLYENGGFKSAADWAQATSIYFDAIWHLIRADEETDFQEKGKLLGIGSTYLSSAFELFGKAGYKDKEKEVQDRLKRVQKEETILFSALSAIKEPSISRSTMGIVAPSCPLESSRSPRLSETRQFSDEERRVIIESLERKKYELVYMDLFKKESKIQKPQIRVGIAQIGVSKSGDIMKELFETQASGLLILRENKIETIKSTIKNMVERAKNEKINIILFPEMSIDLNYVELFEEIVNLAHLYGMYIVPGAFHNQKTKHNISMVIGPEGVLWEQEKHIPATISNGEGKHFKEGIEVSKLPRKTIICNTEYGRIAIAICRDFLDLDLRVELKNFEPPIDIILNPAFTPVTADFKAAHFDARRSIYAYSFFANIGEYGESLIYTPEKDRTERTIPAKKEDIIYKDIDLFKLRSERKKWEIENKKERFFIQSTRY
ncbi:MAG: nitrilase-related carbon-nitrogen hydrolase, partial [Candidatus Hermodarchaeota archaeon]